MADRVIVNADFANAMTSIVPNKARKRWTDKKLESKKYSCSTFMLYLGVDRTYDLPHHQIYASKNYVENLEDIEKHHRLSWDDPSVYVQNACVTDPGLAPEGCATVYVLVPVSHQTENIDWSKESSKFRERILDQIETKLGYENIRDHIVTEMVMTPDDWGDHCYRGAVFNLAHGLDQMLGDDLETDSRMSRTCTSLVEEHTPAQASLSSSRVLESAANSFLTTWESSRIGTVLRHGSKRTSLTSWTKAQSRVTTTKETGTPTNA